jgi:hypothetical protein
MPLALKASFRLAWDYNSVFLFGRKRSFIEGKVFFSFCTKKMTGFSHSHKSILFQVPQHSA